MKLLVVIPARGGSKGVPGKNTKELDGVPLIQYTIDAALAHFDAAKICVTTDSEEIKQVVESRNLEVPFLRPIELATDTAATYEVLLHALDYYKINGYEADTVMLLQPTSPFRTAKHIKEALQLYTEDLDMVVSVKETSANPYYVLMEENDQGFLEKSKKGDFKRRQDCPTVWELNGAIYIINVESLRNGPLDSFTRVVKYEMDEQSSHDIDTMSDWLYAEWLIENKN